MAPNPNTTQTLGEVIMRTSYGTTPAVLRADSADLAIMIRAIVREQQTQSRKDWDVQMMDILEAFSLTDDDKNFNAQVEGHLDRLTSIAWRFERHTAYLIRECRDFLWYFGPYHGHVV
jgi:hypothetical protein